MPSLRSARQWESGDEKIFFDMTHDSSDGVPDGMKVDQKGNIYSTGRAVSGFLLPQASTWEPSSRLKCPQTCTGVTPTPRHCTLRPGPLIPDQIEYCRYPAGNDRELEFVFLLLLPFAAQDDNSD